MNSCLPARKLIHGVNKTLYTHRISIQKHARPKKAHAFTNIACKEGKKSMNEIVNSLWEIANTPQVFFPPLSAGARSSIQIKSAKQMMQHMLGLPQVPNLM